MLSRLLRSAAFTAYHAGVCREPVIGLNRFYESNQWKSPEALSALQDQKLAAVMRHARENVPYYTRLFADCGISEKDFVGGSRLLSRLPLLDKAAIRTHYDDLRARNMSDREVRKNSTSGSTGENLYFLSDAHPARTSCRTLTTFRYYRWCAVDPFDPQAILWGASFDQRPRQSLRDRLSAWTIPLLFLSSYDLSEEKMSRYAGDLIRHRPTFLTSYPTPLERFAGYVLDRNITVPSLRAIICSAEQLYDHQRELIERAFSVPVFNRYGCREFGNVAQECAAHRGMHIAADRVIIEIIRPDGSPAAPGETGELVITDLDNYAMPFIRYRTGDLGAMSGRTCECGRGLPLLDKLEGRAFDLIYRPSGGTVSGTFWTLLIRHVSREIACFQVVQEKKDEVTILLQMRAGLLSHEQEKLLRDKVKEVAHDLAVSIRYVTDIPLTASGKRRFVINKLIPRNAAGADNPRS